MARASANISEMTALEKISGFSAVAEAMALPAAPIPNPEPRAAAPMVSPAANILTPFSIVRVGVMAKTDNSPTTRPYMASASARIVAMKVFSMTSGLSTPAPAIAGPEIPMPRPAPIADRRTLSPAPRPAQNVGQRVTEESVEQSTAISLVQSSSLVLDRARMGGRSLHKTYQTIQPSEASGSERKQSGPLES